MNNWREAVPDEVEALNVDRTDEADGWSWLDEVDPLERSRTIERLRAEERFGPAVLAGAGAALAGAAGWALLSAVTGYQIGFMAIGAGVAVALVVRLVGRGVSSRFGLVGAGFALAVCLVGNLMAIVAIGSRQEGIPVLELVSILTPAVVVDVMIETFHSVDLLFYGLALYYGFNFSFRELTPEDFGR